MATEQEINDPQLNQEIPQEPPQQPPLDYSTQSSFDQGRARQYTSDLFEQTSNMPTHYSPVPAGPYKQEAALNASAGNLSNPPNNDLLSWSDRMQMMNNNIQEYAYNPSKAGRVGSYNSGYDGYNFQRYYTHPNYSTADEGKGLGFSPFRDNETLYNENSSSWQDWQRGNDQFWNVFGAGFYNYFASYGDLGGGLGNYITSSDLENAEEMNRAMAIGMSTQEGVGAWTTNTLLNSGMTFGMIAAFLTEEAALFAGAAAAGSTTGGPGAIPFVTGMVRGMSRFKKGIQAGAKGANLGKMGRWGGGLIHDFKNFNDLGAARVAWNTVKRTGNLINPLENTLRTGKALNAKRLSNSENVIDFMDGYSLFGAMTRDARNINMAFAESKLEAGLVENEVAKKRYNDILAHQDTPLTKDQVNEIESDAKQAGLSTLKWNVPFIYMTNKIVFDGIFQPYRGFRATAKGGFYKTTKKGAVEFVEHTAKPWKKRFYNPKTIGRNFLKYSSRNVAEGVQELYQEGLAAGMNMYYGVSKDSGKRGGYYDTLKKGMGTMYSKEGFGIFMSGFTMGGLVGLGHGSLNAGGNLIDYYQDSKGYKDRKAYEKELRKDNLEKLNTLFDSPIKYSNPLVENGLAQMEIENLKQQAQTQQDYKTWHDLKNSQEFIHVATALNLGMFDGYIDRIKQLQEYNDTELKEAFSSVMSKDELESTDLRARLESMIENAESIKNRKLVADKQINPFDYTRFKVGSEEWIEEQKNYLSFEDVKNQMIFMQHGFDKALQRRVNIINSLTASKPLKNVPASDFTVLLTPNRLIDEIDLLESEINSIELNDKLSEPQKKILKGKKDKLKHLQSFTSKIFELENQLGKSQSQEISEEIAVGARVKINTPKDGYATIVEDLGDKVKLDDGRVVKKENIGLKDIGDSKQIASDDLYDTYVEYVKSLAKNNGEFVTEEQLEDSFAQIIDYHTLTSDLNVYEDAIDQILNPGGFEKYRKRFKEYQDRIWSNKEEDLKKAQKAYEKLLKTNRLLNNLYDAGYFVKPEFVKALQYAYGIKIPFYYRFDSPKADAGKEVTAKEDLDEIQEIVNTYYKEEGIKPVNVTKSPVKAAAETKDKDEDEDEEELTDEITVKTPWSAMDPELQAQIQAVIDKEVKLMMDLGDDIPDDYLIKRIRNSKPGDEIYKIIKDWNEKKKKEEPGLTDLEDLEKQLKAKKALLKKEVDETLIQTLKDEIEEIKAAIKDLKKPVKEDSKEEGPIIKEKVGGEAIIEIKKPSFTNYNRVKLKSGEKTSTIRTPNAKISHISDESSISSYGQFNLADSEYIIEHLGWLTVNQAGGKEKMIKSEALPTKKIEENKLPIESNGITYYAAFPTTVDWLEGKGKMHVYNINRFVFFHDPIDTKLDKKVDDIISKYVDDIITKMNKADYNELENIMRKHEEIILLNQSVIGIVEHEGKTVTVKIKEEKDNKLIQEAYDKNKIRANKNKSIKDFNIGDVVALKGKYHGKTAVISKITKSEIIVDSTIIDDPFTLKIKKTKVKDMISNIVTPAETEDVSPKVSEEDKNKGNSNNETSTNISKDQVEALKNNNTSKQNTENDLFNCE